jgi:hypothetical protein
MHFTLVSNRNRHEISGFANYQLVQYLFSERPYSFECGQTVKFDHFYFVLGQNMGVSLGIWKK